MRAGTIVASNYLAMARVLGESFLEHHPDSTFCVLVVDDGPADLPESIGVVRLGDLDLAPADERMMRTVYDVMEFSTAVKPAFLRHLLAAGPQTEAACYLDPDIQVFASFDAQVDAALEHGIVLTPHVLAPVPRDGMRVDEETIMQSGMYNCGFLAVGPSAGPFLDWWDERLRFDALVDFGRARFTDQRWVDWVPSLFDFTIERDPGMNVAWWNIHDRPIDLAESGPIVQGVPLRFVHFSGYDPQQPGLLSKHQMPRPRTDHAIGTGIRTLADAYGARLIELGHVVSRRREYPWNRSHDGVELTTDLRRVVRDAALDEIDRLGEVRTVPDAFDPTSDFAAWVAARTGHRAAPASTTDSTTPGITRTAPKVVHGSKVVRGSDTRTTDTRDNTVGDEDERRNYDVEFEWTDAHGHAVRLLLDHCEPGVVVDLGCGYAPHAEVLRDAGFEFVGLDVDETSLQGLADRGFVARRADLGRPDQLEEIIAAGLADLGSRSDVVAVMALDVLEHLVEPELLLAMLSDWMRQFDTAVLVTSVPNVAHRDIAAKLLAGRWDVTQTGLLDHTHLRFFTDSSITEVMASAGFAEAMRNDRTAFRSDQRWPAGSPFTSPHTPLASTVAAIRDLADAHGDTYQLIRGYRVDAGPSAPTLMVADPSPAGVALTVIADPGLDADGLAALRVQLDAQTAADWELLAVERPVTGGAERILALDSLLAEVSGAYVAFVERGERVDPRWVEQFVAAMTVTVAGGALDADVSGRVLRCALEASDSGSEDPDAPVAVSPASAAFAFPTSAVRSLGGGFDGLAHPALRLRGELVPYCGETATDVAAVTASDATPEGDDGPADTARALDSSPVAAMLRSAAELPGVVEALHAEIDHLRAANMRLTEHRDRLVRDNEWLNSELAPVPVRVVRRVLRRNASPD
ncbi:MAG: methyltransferase domain-containing protein [Ilumatobacter sp.]|uniref:methyltransferase domain-containing protein n=2 Tax=Ilumatobacter sp. TaxID=1967498 RepID=UPI003296D454